MDSFAKWLKYTNQYSKSDENQKQSHLLLNGGILYVKPEYIELFNTKYAESIIKNEKLYVVECRKEVFPLFFDLDFLLERDYDLTSKIFIDIIFNINDTINIFYNKHYKCIVTTADIKIIKKIDNKDSKEIEYIKKGYHLHYPGLFVNKFCALEIRKSCIIKLKTIYGNCFSNTFSDIIDEHVFVSSGLRLTCSRKGHYVSQTKEFIDEGRPYNLLYVIENNSLNNDEYEKMNSDIYHLIKETSIITHISDITPVENNPNKYCDDCEIDDENENSNNTGNYDDSNYWTRLDRADINYKEIIRYFNTYVKDYKVNDIKRIFHSNNIYIICTKSKYCLNIKRDHNSCGVYFKLNKDGICQKCFCKCDSMDGRKYGYCRDFSSPTIPCTPHLKKLLNFKDDKIDKMLINKITDKNESIDNKLDNVRDLLYNQFTNKSPTRSKKPIKGK